MPASGATCSPSVHLGPRQAPTVIRAYLDPAGTRTLRTFVELRRLVAEHEGKLAVEILLGSDGDQPRTEHARGWAAAMAAHGALVGALRVLRRNGPDRLFVRLADADQYASLAQEVGLPLPRYLQAIASTCGTREVTANMLGLKTRLSEQSQPMTRLPVFVVADQIIDDNATLDRLRPTLGRLRSRARRNSYRAGTPTPQPTTASARMQRPPLRGIQLGGLGLAHRFVLMADDEDDPYLSALLPAVLGFRGDHPGRLTVQVVARGTGLRAQRLRHRLCAARKTGLAVPYLRAIAIDPSERLHDSSFRDLLKRLEEVPAEVCEDEPDPLQLGLPVGAWLDGLPRTHTELEHLARLLSLTRAARRPLTQWLLPIRPESDPPPIDSAPKMR